jgi:hypothetical protein
LWIVSLPFDFSNAGFPGVAAIARNPLIFIIFADQIRNTPANWRAKRQIAAPDGCE